MIAFRGALIAMILLIAGCQTVPIYQASDQRFTQMSNSTLTLDDYKKAIIRGGANRGWTFTEDAPGHLIGNIVVRNKHFVTVDVMFDTEMFSITYNSSRNMKYNAEAQEIHQNYNSWVVHLRRDIQAEVTRMQAL